MKKYIFIIQLLFLFSVQQATASVFTKNFIVHLTDTSRIISNEFNLPINTSKKEDIHNPYVRVSDLNISAISYTSDSDNLIHYLSIEEIINKVKEIDFVEEIPGKSDSHYLKIKFRDNKVVSTTDAMIFRFKGSKSPTRKISVLRFDEYNNTWIPRYIDISKIDKIEFRYRPAPKKASKSKKDKGEKDYKKRVLFSSGNFNKSDLVKKLKSSLMAVKNNSSGVNSTIVLRVNFDFNSSRLNKKASDFLSAIASVMNSPELFNTRFDLRGFTDSTGKVPYNRKLSKKRADSVKKYLIGSNVSPGRLKSYGYGESMPVAPNTSDFYKSLNRRVEIYPVVY